MQEDSNVEKVKKKCIYIFMELFQSLLVVLVHYQILVTKILSRQNERKASLKTSSS